MENLIERQGPVEPQDSAAHQSPKKQLVPHLRNACGAQTFKAAQAKREHAAQRQRSANMQHNTSEARTCSTTPAKREHAAQRQRSANI